MNLMAARDDNLPIFELFQHCVSSLSQIISCLRIRNNIGFEVSSLEDDFGRFNAWGNSTGAHRKGRVSLDHRLRHATNLFQTVSVLLETISNSAERLNRIATDPSCVPYESQTFPEDSSSSSDESIGEIIARKMTIGTKFVPLVETEAKLHLSNLRNAISHLYVLAASFTNPAPESRFLKSERIDRSFYEAWDIKHVEAKFEAGNRSLIERLGKANTRRRQIIAYLERHHGKVAMITESSANLPDAAKTVKRERERIHNSQTEASQTTVPTIIEVTKPSQSSFRKYEEDDVSEQSSVMSSQAQNLHGPKIPSPPKTDENDSSICPYCHEVIRIATVTSWRKHMYEDLQAYVCTNADCHTPNRLFSKRSDWYQHEIQHRAKEYICNFCKGHYSTENIFKSHLSIDHQIPSDRHQLYAELCQQSKLDSGGIQRCLLCLEDTRNYRSHMSHHLQDIALFVLPRDISEEDDAEEIRSTRAQLVTENSSKGSFEFGEGKSTSTLSFEEEDIIPDFVPQDHHSLTDQAASSDDDELLSRQQYLTGPEDPGLSFIFIVNELAVNEDFNTGVPPQHVEGRWVPPSYGRGFYRQTPGRVYRWDNGHVSKLDTYKWHHVLVDADDNNDSANGIVANPDGYLLKRYRTATVFYTNPFMKFRTAPGDASARDLYTDGEIWHHLRFHHVGPYGNISYVDHAGSEDYVAGQSSNCPWHKQVIPPAYECQDEETFQSGGLAGLLPILIALMAFSCSPEELDETLIRDRSWRNRNWVRHNRRTGRREKRGMVVTVYLDPENPEGSTFESLSSFEDAGGEAGRPILNQATNELIQLRLGAIHDDPVYYARYA